MSASAGPRAHGAADPGAGPSAGRPTGGDAAGPTWSASDLVAFVHCDHLAWLTWARRTGALGEEPPAQGDDAAFVADRGRQHEDEHVAALTASLELEGKTWRRIAPDLVAEGRPTATRRELAAATAEAMRDGIDVIFQGALLDGGWFGIADMLRRVDGVPSTLGDHAYEVVDIKLARSVKPTHALQLCLYADLLERVQGWWPRRAGIVLGTGVEVAVDLADVAASYRRVRDDFLAAMAAMEQHHDDRAAEVPEPAAFCAQCQWAPRCAALRERADHLSLVAGIRTDQRRKLADAGITTVAALAACPAGTSVPRLPDATFARLHQQAAKQVEGRSGDGPTFALRTPQGFGQGLALLPEPSRFDVFFDLEGDPYVIGGGAEGATTGGLEYLWGAVTVDQVDAPWGELDEPPAPTGDADDPAAAVPHGEYLQGRTASPARTPRFHAWWAHDPAQEKAAFEAFIDWLMARRAACRAAGDPDLHVYHYASYEISAIRRMMGRYATREAEVDTLLREEVFVDLYRVVRQSIVTSQPSYSIKKVEAFYRPARAGDVQTAGSSIVEYERWLHDRDEHRLRAIAHYNRDDCVSTFQLARWLDHLKAMAAHDGIAWPTHADGLRAAGIDVGVEEEGADVASGTPIATLVDGDDGDDDAGGRDIVTRRAALRDCLLDGVPTDVVGHTPLQRARHVLAHLLDFHRREAKPAWWAFFERVAMTADEHVDDTESLGDLMPSPDHAPYAQARSTVHVLTFPPQESKLRERDTVHAPVTGRSAGTIVRLDDAAGLVHLKRGPKMATQPLPGAVLAGGPISTTPLEAALERVATAVVADGLLGDGADDAASHRYRAVVDLVAGAVPQIDGVTPGSRLLDTDTDDVDAACRLVLGLDRSYLCVQGPPGSGKTYTGAHMVIALVRAGRVVGITGPSHAAIRNLLVEVDRLAARDGVDLRAACKGPRGEASFEGDRVRACTNNAEVADLVGTRAVNVVAGTAWLFASGCLDGMVDHLLVDEAGQVSLANAVAAGSCARNLVLLGDPQQLPQVLQGTHPPHVAASALEHVIGERDTVPRTHGIFLPVTRRMHPQVCAFVSDTFYDGELGAHPWTAANAVTGAAPVHLPACAGGGTLQLPAAGVVFVPVAHHGCRTRSDEEAEVVAALHRAVVGATFASRDPAGGEERSRDVDVDDVLVVAPYNVQVGHLLRAALPASLSAGDRADRLRVGTVDRFQGQEAPVVIYSMTSSSAEDVPRDLGFLLSPNRVNVAISRAQALAIVVASPALLRAACASIEEMRLVDVVCRFAEAAGAREGGASDQGLRIRAGS